MSSDIAPSKGSHLFWALDGRMVKCDLRHKAKLLIQADPQSNAPYL